jgi:integrase
VRGKSREAIYLVNSEIECIRTFETQDPKLAFSRDCFLFQIFTGLAFCDIKKFSRSDVQDLNDYKIIRGTRKKTGQVFVSLFLPEAQAIAEKYEYQFFLPTNITYNKYIKRLAAHCGINKPITSHSARHTYATYLLNKGVRIETVSRAMGHGDIQMTQSYAKLLANTIVEEMAQKLVQHIK